MIAWKQPPATAMTAHPGYSLDDCPVLRPFGVEDVASNDDVLRPVFDRCAPKCVDCLEPRLAKAGPNFGLEAPKRFAELPVSRMDEFQDTSPWSGAPDPRLAREVLGRRQLELNREDNARHLKYPVDPSLISNPARESNLRVCVRAARASKGHLQHDMGFFYERHVALPLAIRPTAEFLAMEVAVASDGPTKGPAFGRTTVGGAG